MRSTLASQDHLMFSYDSSPAGMTCRQWKPSVEHAPNCPRCDSSNTKFCYYNNYSLSQPRYFCKGCRRYWTKGGSLRNVPQGGGCRKSRRGKSFSARNSADGTAALNRQCPPAISSTVRPDLALDGAAQTIESKVAENGGGPSIDLAVLSAKYLNQCPEQTVVPDFAGELEPEPLTSGESSSNDLDLECQILGVELLMENSNADLYHRQNFEEQLNPFADPSKNLDSIQALQLHVHQMETNFFPSDICDLDVQQLVSGGFRYQDFEPSFIPALNTSLNQSFTNGEDHWSTTQLDYPSLETFYGP